MYADIGYADQHGEWVATIIDDDEIVDIGCELMQEAAYAWAKRALQYYEGSVDDYPADMYDRVGSISVN